MSIHIRRFVVLALGAIFLAALGGFVLAADQADDVVIYVSSSSSGSTDGIGFKDEDILAYNSVTDTWTKHFDGSDVGLAGSDIDALHVLSDGNPATLDPILMSFNNRPSLPGPNPDDSDIVLFTPTSLGTTTAGTFSIWFDGSDFGLRTSNEDVDAIAFAPDGRLIVSTRGTFQVPKDGGGPLPGKDEDLIVLEASGRWSRYFDGSDVKLRSSSEDVHGAFVDEVTETVFLSTKGGYSVSGLSGDKDDIISFVGSLGSSTSGVFERYFNGDTHRFANENINAFSIEYLNADLSITKSDSPDPVVAGESLTYTVTVANAGPAQATGVVVTDTLPAGVTFSSTSGCAEDPNGAPTCSLGSIASGASKQYTITVTVSPSTTGVITNSATVVADQPDTNPGDNTATEDTVVNQRPVITSDGGGATAAVDVDENTTAVTDVNASDDNDSEGAGLTYAITGGADAAEFDLNTNTGVLTFGSAPDFENPVDAGADNVYDVEVTVTDSGGLTDVQDIAVTVLDVAEDDAPTVSSTTPADSATSVPTDANVSITFSEAVTVTGDWVELVCTTSGTYNPTGSGGATVLAVTDADPTFTLNPAVDFDGGETCTATVESTLVADDDAVDPPDNMAADYVFSFSTVPIANDDTYFALGNVGITPNANNGVIGGGGGGADEGTGLSVSEVEGSGANVGVATSTGAGGTVTVLANGSFDYTPPAGYEGADGFTYQVSGAAGTSNTATVTINIADMIWFIDNSAGGAGGSGVLSDPFRTIGDFNGSGATDPGDNIYLAETGTDYSTGIVLQNGQLLIGEGTQDSDLQGATGVSVPSFTYPLPPINGTRPVIDSSGTSVLLASNNTVRGLNVVNTGGTGILGGSVGSLMINDVESVDVTDGEGISLTDGTWNVDIAAVTVNNTTPGSDRGIALATGGASTANFGTVDITTNGEIGIQALNAGTVNVTDPSSTVDATGAGAINVFGTTLGMTFTSLDSSGGGDGIRLENIGASSFSGGTTTIVSPSQQGIDINGASGSSIVFGNTAITGSGLQGVRYRAASGATLDFANLSINNTATNAVGFLAEANGGTGALGVVTGTIDSGSATAVDVSNTVLNVTLTGVSSVGGSTPGIDLSSTTGSFTIAGSGDGVVDCRNSAGACAGGDITGKTANADGIRLNNVTNVALNEMNISSNSGNGIFGTDVNGFTIDDSRLIDNTDTDNPNENAINFDGLTGTSPGGSHPTVFSNIRVEDSHEHNVEIRNSSGTLTNLRIEDSIFSNDGGSALAANHINFLAQGSASMKLNVQSSEFIGNRGVGALTGSGVFADGQAIATLDVVVQGSTFEDNNNAINVSHSGSGNVDFLITGNDIVGNLSAAEAAGAGGAGTAINVVMSTTYSGAASGVIDSNTIGDDAVTESGSATGRGIVTDMDGSGALTVEVTNNTIRQTDSYGIKAWTQETNGGDLIIMVTGNALRNVTSNGIYLRSRDGAGNTMCAVISGNTADATTTSTHIRLREDTGAVSLETGSSASTNPTTVLTDNNPGALTWDGDDADATNPAVVANSTCGF